MAGKQWVQAVKVSDIPEGGGILFEPEGKAIAIFKSGENFFAIDNACPHRGGPLAEGHLENREVTCPWHAWAFDVKTGACINAPGVQVNTYAVKTEDDIIFVEL